jgi:hypothetical protein
MTTDWHPFWISYEWWRDIGTGLMSVAAALALGITTISVAIGSRRLAKKVSDREEVRGERADVERYRDQMVRVIEPAVTALVAYGNAMMATSTPNSKENEQLRADALARLALVDAVANQNDRLITHVINLEFFEATDRSHHPVVRQNVAGRFAGALAGVIAHRDPFEDRLADVKATLEQEEAEHRRRSAAHETARCILGV